MEDGGACCARPSERRSAARRAVSSTTTTGGLPLGKINLSRVILGGLVAGLVINIGEFILNTYVIGEQSAAAMARLGLPAIGPQQIVWFVVFGFLYGIWLVWLYAAIRPR